MDILLFFNTIDVNVPTFNHSYASAGTYIVKIVYSDYSEITEIFSDSQPFLISYSQPFLRSLTSLVLLIIKL